MRVKSIGHAHAKDIADLAHRHVYSTSLNPRIDTSTEQRGQCNAFKAKVNSADSSQLLLLRCDTHINKQSCSVLAVRH